MEKRHSQGNPASGDGRTRVFLIGSIHYKLATNPRFTMQYLKDYIRQIGPDIIGVEMMAEHMGYSDEELNKLYAPEFPAIKREFEGTAAILPFNWMTRENMEDRPGFLANNKKMRQDMMDAPGRQGEKAFLGMVNKAIDVIGDRGSAADVNSLAWDQLVSLKHQFERSIIKGTEIEETWLYMSGELNQTRIAAIDENIKAIIQDNPGKTIVILAGAIHRVHIIPYIQQHLPDIEFITEIQ